MGDARIPDDWEGEYCEFSVCWPNSPQWLAVLRGVLSIAAEGRFWNEATGNIVDTQEIIEQTFAYNFRNWEVIMSCGSDALSQIAISLNNIASAQCCGAGNLSTSGGVVTSYEDSDGNNQPVYGSAPPKTNNGIDPPEGFDTYEDYLLNKCQIANLVFDGFLLTIRGFAGFTVFNATALAILIPLAFAGFVVFPPAAIPVMVGALIVLGSFVAMFTTIADNLESNRADIVCDLYNSATVEEATIALSNALDAAIALLETTGPIATALKLVAMTVTNSDTLGQLMSGVAGASYPDADCSACGSCTVTGELTAGTGDFAIDGEAHTYTSENISGTFYVRITNTSSPKCNFQLAFTDTSDTGIVFETDVHNAAGDLMYEQNDPVPVHAGGMLMYGNFSDFPGLISISSAGSFTVDIVLDQP